MRRFFKKLRKGIKQACLTTALITCWHAGQAAQAGVVPPPVPDDEVTVRFSGSVSPATNDVSHLFLIYGSGFSDSDWAIDDIGAVKLGDFPSGQTRPFSVLATAIYDHYFWWFAAGLYGDISSGQYIEGVNGVTLGINASVGEPWDMYISEISEETMFNYLLNDDSEHLAVNQYRWDCWYMDYDFFSPGTNLPLLDFSDANYNGEIQVAYEIVPEPLTVILLGTGGVLVLYQRRHKD